MGAFPSLRYCVILIVIVVISLVFQAGLQPLFFGLGFWRVESYISKAKEPGDTQAFTGAMLACVAALSTLWLGVEHFHIFEYGGGSSSQVVADQLSIIRQLMSLNSWTVMVAILWTGLVTTALTSFVENEAMKKLSVRVRHILACYSRIMHSMLSKCSAYSRSS